MAANSYDVEWFQHQTNMQSKYSRKMNRGSGCAKLIFTWLYIVNVENVAALILLQLFCKKEEFKVAVKCIVYYKKICHDSTLNVLLIQPHRIN